MEQPKPITINFPRWNKIINDTFVPLVNNTDRYMVCIGGRGSSKSIFAAKKLIYRCLHEKYFRYILYRKTYNSIKDSQFQTIKDIVDEWGLSSLFTFNVSPLEIRCANGNKFICRGGDEPKKLKSIKDPTGVWYEEEIPEESDFITITSGIRTTKAEYLQEIFTVNPEVEGNYEDHWFFKKFFKDKPETSFRSKLAVTMPGGQEYIHRYTVHFSTYLDNRWLPDSFVANLLQLKQENPYYYTIYALGKWGNRSTGGNFWKHFNRAHHTGTTAYNPSLPVHLSFDFNVNPYMTCLVFQVQGTKVWLIDEILPKHPNNTTIGACKEFMARYPKHEGGMFIYGDPSGFAQDTRSEKGHNDFVLIINELRQYKPMLRVDRVHPSVVQSGNWLNAVLYRQAGGIEIIISDKAQTTINDFQYVKEAEDGTMAKQRVKDKDTGVSYEKYGHPSDAFRYFMCMCFASKYAEWMSGGVSNKPMVGKSFNNRW